MTDYCRGSVGKRVPRGLSCTHFFLALNMFGKCVQQSVMLARTSTTTNVVISFVMLTLTKSIPQENNECGVKFSQLLTGEVCTVHGLQYLPTTVRQCVVRRCDICFYFDGCQYMGTVYIDFFPIVFDGQ